MTICSVPDLKDEQKIINDKEAQDKEGKNAYNVAAIHNEHGKEEDVKPQEIRGGCNI